MEGSIETKGFSGKYKVGKVQSYIGTVEAQGRGTLHLHTLLWLKDAPTAHEMNTVLKSETFREKIKHYIENVIHADIEGKDREAVSNIPKEQSVSYARPVNPRISSSQEADAQEKKLARVLQFHQCTLAACLKMVKGKLVCKRRAPFAIAREAWVDENGNWGPKRLCDMLNTWNPGIMHCIAANHDIKMISSGKDTATITYYITNYATKKQERSSNTSALLAKAIAFSKTADRKQNDLNVINRKLITRCANSLNCYREFSAPEVMTYIMGWGDVYESHHYVSIFWDDAMKSLLHVFPELQTTR